MVRQEILDEMEFQKKISDMPDRQLLEYVAREQYYMKLQYAELCQETGYGKKKNILVGAGSGGIMAFIMILGDYIITRLKGG